MGCSSSSQFFVQVQFCLGMGGKTPSKNNIHLPHCWRFFLGWPQPSWLPKQIGHFSTDVRSHKHPQGPRENDRTQHHNVFYGLWNWLWKNWRFVSLPRNSQNVKIWSRNSQKHIKKTTLVKIKSLIGLLNFTCAGAFLRRIIDSRLGGGGIKALSPHQDHPVGEERSADLATLPGGGGGGGSRPYHHIRITQ